MIGGELEGNEQAGSRQGGAIEPLTQSTLSQLRLGWSSRYDLSELRTVLQEYPGLSLWVPETGEYLIGGAWRFREEIAGMLELSARANAVRLLDEFAEVAGDQGKRLAIASEHHESRRRAFYDAAGYELVEEILIYEYTRPLLARPPGGRLRFAPVNLDDEAALTELIELDHAAFPWLWWNSRGEFANYGHSAGVEIYLGRDPQSEAVAYIGLTHFRDWGHLDRIAVAPRLQGQGYGLEALDWAVYFLGRSGARRVGLSTQARNERSRTLYERYGFRRSPVQDYALYGRWLGQPPADGELRRG